MKNDVSFIIGNTINLYEQQSTLNYNMPIRGLLYFSKLYDKYISVHKYNIYSKTMIKLPTHHNMLFSIMVWKRQKRQ